MTDIIANAKQLLDGATPGPWEWEKRSHKDDSECKHDWLGSEHGAALVTTDSDEYASWVEASDSDKTLIAAVPELAQALSEETHEYAVQVSNGSKWLFLGPHPGGYRSAKGAYWFMREETAQSHRKFIEDEHFDTRIVRRRVSPPEVINE